MKNILKGYYAEIIKVVIIFSLFATFRNTSATINDSLITKLKSSEGKEKVLLIHQLTRKYFFEKPTKARDLSLEALKLSKELGNDSLVAYSYNYLGLAYYFLDYWTLSVNSYKKSMATEYAKNSLHFNAALANNIAIDYELLGEYNKSVEYYLKALKIKEPQKDSSFIAKTFMNLGLLDIKMHKPSEAIKKFKFSLPIFIKEQDFRNVASCYQNLSIAEFNIENVEKAEIYFNKAVKHSTDSINTAAIYLDFSDGLFENKMYRKSLSNYYVALSYSDSLVTPATYFRIIQGIGKSLLFLGRVKESKKFLLLADSGLRRNGADLWLQSNKLNLAQLYAKSGNWNKFNNYLDAYSNLQVANMQKKDIRTVEELSVIYQTEKKNRQIEFQNTEIENKNKRIIFISVITILVSLGLFITLYLTRKLKFANNNLIEKNLELSERWNQLQKFYGSAESDTNTNSQNELFRRIYQLMVNEQAYTKTDITVDFLSKQLKSNTKYISKAIKEETGMNFNTFINTFRIEEAKRILRDKISSTWSLDAVAVQSGFNNTTSFFQAFKKNTGLTPTAFRNALVTSVFK